MEHLEKLNLEIREPIAGTGIEATLHCKDKGKVIVIRTDIDALPIYEKNNVSFRSLNDGFMHACGHDAHMSMIYGSILLFNEIRNNLKGSIKFIFQPAEEEGMLGGAKQMIKEGIMDDVDYILGIHVWPELSEGYVGYRNGPFFASADTLTIDVFGRGGHGAKPHSTVDPIVVSARVVEALQSIASREVFPLKPIVVTVGSISGGTAHNVIPNRVTMKGTIRTMNPDIREKIENMLRRIIGGITSSSGASYEMKYVYGCPVLVNDEEITKRVIESAKKIVGLHRVVLSQPTMGSEDFAYYLQRVKGTFLLLGVRNESLGFTYGVHTTRFNLNDNVLPIGSSVLTQGAVDLLQNAK